MGILLFILTLVACSENTNPLSIVSIENVGKNTEGYIYEIIFLDNSSYQFIVPFGQDGKDGQDGTTPILVEMVIGG